ncbi:MAG: OadG family protein [Bacilli bacterium]|nr:OadG family protein [Bacilli bacterium]
MNLLGIWPDLEDFNVLDSLVVSLIAIVIVFFVLFLLIVITGLVNKGAEKITGLTNINAREENKILDEDPDAAVAVLVATIDFNKETGKDANVVSVTRIED